MKFMTKIFYNGIYGLATHMEVMEGRSVEKVELAVLDEINKKRFISLGGGVIVPTNSIAEIKIDPIEEEKEAGE